MSPLITQQHIDSYQADGAVLVKGLFADHVDDIAVSYTHLRAHETRGNLVCRRQLE